MTLINPLIKVTAAAALTALLAGGLNSVRAAELDCGAMAAALNPGDSYEFKLELQSKMMRIEMGDDFCTEPASKWFKRQLILPPPARLEMPLPRLGRKPEAARRPAAASDVPLPGQQMRRGPMPDLGLGTDAGEAPLPIQRRLAGPENDAVAAPDDNAAAEPQAPAEDAVAPPPILQRDDNMLGPCDRDLAGFWSPGEHSINGQKFWLSGVFTIDLDSDGRVDDVGFKIKSEGRIGNILNYFPSTEGRLSGKTVAGLKLDDDSDIFRLCPGNITFARHTAAASPADPAKTPMAAAVKQDDQPAEEDGPETPPAKNKLGTFTLVVVGIAMVMLLGGGIGLAFAIRGIIRSREDEDEDEEEDE